MSEHTREPWEQNDNRITGHNKTGVTLFNDLEPDDARRIVACVNACEGIATETLENRIKYTFTDVEKRNKELEAQLAASQQREAELREIIAEARAQTNNIVIQEILEQVEYKALSGGG